MDSANTEDWARVTASPGGEKIGQGLQRHLGARRLGKGDSVTWGREDWARVTASPGARRLGKGDSVTGVGSVNPA